MNCRFAALLLLFLSLNVLFGLLLGARAVQAQAGPLAIKIAIEPVAQTIRVGQMAQLTIVLLDADNRPVPATQAVPITLEVHPQSGSVQTQILTVDAGQSQQSLSLTLSERGITKVFAKQRELRQGEALIHVRRSARGAASQMAALTVLSPPVSGPPVSAPPAAPTTIPAPDTASQLPVTTLPSAAPADSSMPPADTSAPDSSVSVAVPANPVPSADTPPADPPSPAAPSAPTLTLWSNHDGPALADGKDQVKIVAFLSPPATQDITLSFFSDGGTLSATTLHIPKGQEEAQCTLTSQQPGPVQFHYLGADPATPLDPDSQKMLTVNFVPSIVSFVVQPSPSRMSLLDQAYFVVKLLDEDQTPRSSDTDQQVFFVMNNGNGEIAPATLTIPAGSFESQTVFLPDWLGPVQVTASMTGMRDQSAKIDVKLPLPLLAFSLIGGLLGGGIAYLAGKDKKLRLWRVAIGIVTGFVFYWLSLYFGLGHLAHTVVVNPLSACVLSIFGGWAGTAVLDMAGKKLNLPPSKPAAS